MAAPTTPPMWCVALDADVTADPMTGQNVDKVSITLDPSAPAGAQATLAADADAAAMLRPGMAGEAFFETRRRSPICYLFMPLFDQSGLRRDSPAG